MSVGPFFKTITLNNLSKNEAYEIVAALVARYNSARQRLNGNRPYTNDSERSSDELTVSLCPPIIDGIQKIFSTPIMANEATKK